MSDARKIIKEILEFINETETYEEYKEQLKRNIKKINEQYQNKSFGYLEYEAQLKTSLKNKSEEEWIHYYNAYLFSLIKKIDFLLAQLYTEIYEYVAEKKIEEKPLIKALLKRFETEEKKAVSLDEEIAALKQQIKTPAAKGTLGEAKIDIKFADRVKKLREKIKEREELARTERQKAEEEQRVLKEQKELEREKGLEQEEAAQKEAEAALPEKKSKIPKIYSPKEVTGELLAVIKRGATIVRTLTTKVHIPSIHKKPAEKIVLTKETPIAKPATTKPAAKFSLLTQIRGILTRKKMPKTAITEEEKPIEITPRGKFDLKSLLKTFLTKKPKAAGLFSIKNIATPKKRKLFIEEIVGMEQTTKLREEKKFAATKILFGWPLGRKLLGDMLGRFREKQEPIMGVTTHIPVHIKKLGEMRQRLYAEEHLGGMKPTLLAEEAHRIKSLLEQVEKPEIYKGSSIGLIANVSVKKISLWLVDTFPEFFGYLYNALRAANVKILSNTYVNIMILCTMGMFGSLLVLLTVFFFITGYPIYQVFMRSLVFSLIGSGLCATTFYLYPFIKIKDRRKSMTTNMPFAINHLASVSASGVAPAAMFELIAQSKEYGEVATEIKKIVDFVNIFGYDLLTAIKSVSATTPSIEFKEFLEGMVSTIEAGGDLESYLKQKAQESTLKYQLERQRYNETISTYSDLYTGLLIAAPLFFIAAMALINMLGGSLGGMSVDLVMALGAYVMIPVLNIAFIAFLQVSQPSV